MHFLSHMGHGLQDLQFTFRTLAKSPVFVLVTALTLGLGIGVNTAIFSSVNSMRFRPMPVKDGERLVVLAVRDRESDFAHGLSYPDFLDYRSLTDVFEGAAAFQVTVVNFQRGTETDRLYVEAVSDNYFPFLGLQAAQGRLFGPGDERSPLLVLSYSCWKGRFGGDPYIVGSNIRLNKRTFTIAGIAPESYHGGISYVESDGFVPLKAEGLGLDSEGRDARGWRVLARLRKGIRVEQARAAALVRAAQLERQYPATNQGVKLLAMYEMDSRPEPQFDTVVPAILALAMALVGMLLMIACANIANLLLVRVANRSRELAIRAALGAGRAQLIWLLFDETLVLSALGLGTGLLLSSWMTGYFSAFQPGVDFHFRSDYTFDWRVMAFTIAVTLLTSLVCVSFPAFQMTRWDLNQVIKHSGGPQGSAKRHLGKMLVVGQVAISLVLLIAAGLNVKALRNANQIDLGYRLQDRAVFSFNLGQQGYKPKEAQLFLKRLVDKVKMLPEVQDVSFAQHLPFNGFTPGRVYRHDETPGKKDAGRIVMRNVVGPDYFRTMGAAVLEGREFTAHDDDKAQRVAVVNQALAGKLWPGQSPVGQLMKLESGETCQVIGVVKTGKYFTLVEEPQPWYYVPLEQQPVSWGSLVVHASGPPAAAIADVRQSFRSLDTGLVVYQVMTMEHLVRDGYLFGPFRFGSQAATAFGIAGLLLAAIGIYGIVSFSASQRTKEIGIRLGLGANRRDVLMMVMRQGLKPILTGVAIGLAVALAGGAFVPKNVLGIQAVDPLLFIAVTALLIAVGLIASYIPSRRAARLDPVNALRCD
ncbi:MAG: ABC transporter permease [Bryobacteraceae bacterium]